MAKVTITAEQAKRLAPTEDDWEAFDSLSPEQVHQAALEDPDAAPLTPEQLKRFRPVVKREQGVYANEPKLAGYEAKRKSST